MAANPGYTQVDTPFGRVGLLEAFAPDIALLHAPIADRAGNLAFNATRARGRVGGAGRPAGRGRHRRPGGGRHPPVVAPGAGPRPTGCWPSPRRPWAPIPVGCSPVTRPVEPYGEDLEFWAEARDASRGDRLRRLDPALGARPGRPGGLPRPTRSRPHRRPTTTGRADSWRDDEAAHPPDLDAPVGGLGVGRRRSVPATWPTGCSPPTPTPSSPVRASPTWPPGSPSRSPASRDPTSC